MFNSAFFGGKHRPEMVCDRSVSCPNRPCVLPRFRRWWGKKWGLCVFKRWFGGNVQVAAARSSKPGKKLLVCDDEGPRAFIHPFEPLEFADEENRHMADSMKSLCRYRTRKKRPRGRLATTAPHPASFERSRPLISPEERDRTTTCKPLATATEVSLRAMALIRSLVGVVQQWLPSLSQWVNCPSQPPAKTSFSLLS